MNFKPNTLCRLYVGDSNNIPMMWRMINKHFPKQYDQLPKNIMESWSKFPNKVPSKEYTGEKLEEIINMLWGQGYFCWFAR